MDVQPQAAATSCFQSKFLATLQLVHHQHVAALLQRQSRHRVMAVVVQGEEDSQSSTITNDAQFSKSWLVSGMDCPACARKIEKARSVISTVVCRRCFLATENWL
ncbi:hypothetical protein OK016_15440 [Vibrio chagasii]|nr:hypothetical protein [Vibrio chagasii]